MDFITEAVSNKNINFLPNINKNDAVTIEALKNLRLPKVNKFVP